MLYEGPARCTGAGRQRLGRPRVTGCRPSVAVFPHGTPAPATWPRGRVLKCLRGVYGHRMRATPETILQLRHADEDDVEAALAGSYVEDVLASVERAALLEFYNRMLDRAIGARDDD